MVTVDQLLKGMLFLLVRCNLSTSTSLHEPCSVVFISVTRGIWQYQIHRKTRFSCGSASPLRSNNRLNRLFYSCMLSCQAFEQDCGGMWSCYDRDHEIVWMITKWFTCERQLVLYHNQATLVQTFDDCKMIYCRNLCVPVSDYLRLSRKF